MNNTIGIKHLYYVECYDKNGVLKWTEGFKNIVVTVGLNEYLDKTLKSASSPAWYIGLKNATAAVAGDTMGTKGFTEITAYSNGTRPVWTAGTVSAGSVDNSGSPASFSINGPATVAGAFMVNQNTVGGTTGILLGAGEFSTSRSVLNGDTLNVTVTCVATSA